MFGRRRRSGMSLSTLLVVAGGLYFTGAGGWVVEQMQGLPNACYSQLGSVNATASRVICGMAGETVKTLDRFSGSAGKSLDGFFNGIWSQFAENLNFDTIAGQLDVPDALVQAVNGLNLQGLQGLQSPEEMLSQLMQSGPGSLGVGSGPTEQLKAALNSMAIGQKFLSPDSGSFEPSAAVGWLQQGAMQNEFGLMPQLSLGNLYLQGGQGIPANPALAANYYQQALGSLQALQGSPQPGAQQMISSLPVSPAQMQKEIIGVIRAIKPQQ